MQLEINSSPVAETLLPKSQPGKSFPLFYLQLRGLVLLAIAMYWALYPASDHADIVAATISYALLAFITALSLVTLIAGALGRNRVAARAYIRDKKSQEFDSYSSENSTLGIQLDLPGITPFFQYELRAQFEPESPGETLHIVRGKVTAPVYLEQTIHFPHRGIWQLTNLSVCFCDRFGLSSFRYDIGEPYFHKDVRVAPLLRRTPDLPITSSIQTSGDELSAEYERKGDYLDIKPYHPADGTRRILWKIFARSGELLSRHPEKTYTPEGELLLYVPAGKSDDLLCGLVLGYLEQVEERGLAFRLRCAGQEDRLKSAGTLQDARALFIQTAWQANHHDLQRTCREIQPLLESSPGTIFIPLSSARLSSQPFENLLQRTGGFLASKGMKPSFLIFNIPQSQNKREDLEDGDMALRRFSSTCTTRGWDCKMIYI